MRGGGGPHREDDSAALIGAEGVLAVGKLAPDTRVGSEVAANAQQVVPGQHALGELGRVPAVLHNRLEVWQPVPHLPPSAAPCAPAHHTWRTFWNCSSESTTIMLALVLSAMYLMVAAELLG